jgi:hypothetical protein
MTLLQKIGVGILKGIGLVQAFMGMGAMVYPGAGSTIAHATDDLTKVFGAVQTVEAVIGAISDPAAKTGPQKLKAVTPLIAQIVQQTETVAGRTLKNEALFIQGCTKMGDGAADIMNAFE